MLVPLTWLKEYIELPANPADLVERLALAGLESSSVKVFGLPVPQGLRVKPQDQTPVWERDQLMVAKVLQIDKHPNADKLKLVKLDYGQAEPKTVVTGAPNIAPGQSGMKVILGLRGTTYYMQNKEGGKTLAKLEPKELRGVPNDAMCMSNFELGIADDHDGIIILDENDAGSERDSLSRPVQSTRPGTPIQDLLGEIVIELDVLPNMARCLSMLGVAREVAALTGKQICEHQPDPFGGKSPGSDIKGKVTVKIENAKLCARYSASIIEHVSIGKSPGLISRRLQYSGMRPINNAVDITNYVMLETGQPLHAFDYDILVQRAGGKSPTITVRSAKQGETLKTLDQQLRELTTDDLLICDTVGPIALAGVMGGLETEVTETTKTILLESASFDFVSVRKTARKFNLFSEASGRFSRGVHPEIVGLAAARACELFAKHANGTVLKGMVDEYPAPLTVTPIKLDRREIERLLGISIPDAEVERVLGALQFKLEESPWGWNVTPPATRLDIQAGAADLIEELARVSGYDRLPDRLLSGELPPQTGNRSLALEEKLRDVLADCGLSEAITYSFSCLETEAKLQRIALPAVKLVNPISPDRSTLRRTLLPGLLEVMHRNLQSNDHVGLFELGPVFFEKSGELPDEPRRVAIALAGRKSVAAWDDDLSAKPQSYDFFDLKGVIETLAASFHLPGVSFAKPTSPNAEYLHPGRSADFIVNGKIVGSFGELHPKPAIAFGLAERGLQVAEFDLDALLNAVPSRSAYLPFSTFPPAKRDIAIVIPQETTAAAVLAELKAAGGELLSDVQLFDVYTGDRIPAGTKSLAYALSYQAPDRTLGEKEIDKAHQKIESRLKHMLKAQIRGKDLA